MRRREALAAIIAACGVSIASKAGAQTTHAALQPLWQRWKAAHLDMTGRVIDRPQGGASHSEGQGYGMLLAALLGDEPAFRSMHDWTRANLALRDDALLAWRWLPQESPHVPDRNNASDGDLFYAWALQRGAERFGRPELARASADVSAALLSSCLFERPDRPGARLLLPALFGFRTTDRIIYNPSYGMPLAMRSLAAAHGHGAWLACAAATAQINRDLAAGGMVPDWVAISSQGLAAAPGFRFESGYEAIRVPLFMLWSGYTDSPELMRFAAAQSGQPNPVQTGFPVVFDRRTGAVLERSPDPGYGAIGGLVSCAASAGTIGAPMPPFVADQPYYPATLHLFALMAQREVLQRCTPL
ncbi:MAG: glycosyl hydrolase family 5 [Pararhodobacter sp.]|nr:glycosyl hydrolase family 5 [Pararhodobacter sp.]